jgi:hypothetical protein
MVESQNVNRCLWLFVGCGILIMAMTSVGGKYMNNKEDVIGFWMGAALFCYAVAEWLIRSIHDSLKLCQL